MAVCRGCYESPCKLSPEKCGTEMETNVENCVPYSDVTAAQKAAVGKRLFGTNLDNCGNVPNGVH